MLLNMPLWQQVGDNIKNNFREICFGNWELAVTGTRSCRIVIFGVNGVELAGFHAGSVELFGLVTLKWILGKLRESVK
jgi:hypothetical protein